MNDPRVDKVVDQILDIFKDQDALPIAYEAMDKIYRPFLQWIHRAQEEGTDAVTVRGSLLNLISAMIVETGSRMSERTPDGERIPKELWLGEFMLDLKQELIDDLEYHGKHH
jgi:hypothetical protein